VLVQGSVVINHQYRFRQRFTHAHSTFHQSYCYLSCLTHLSTPPCRMM
jgi:hypothetical protein